MRSSASVLTFVAALLVAACSSTSFPASGVVAPANERLVVDVGTAPIRGPSDASVTLVEFGDFQCPYCGEEEPIVQQLSSAYGTELRVAFKEFPLAMHEYAEVAAEAALAAKAQGEFWPFHDTLYAHQDALTATNLTAYATTLGLEVNTFETALSQGIYRAAVQADISQGTSLGVDGTPTFFVNGRMAVGALPYATLAAAIDEEIGIAR